METDEKIINARYKLADALLARLPEDIRERVTYGLYGGQYTFYITDVDGTLAMLTGLDSEDKLREYIAWADKENAKLVKRMRHAK